MSKMTLQDLKDRADQNKLKEFLATVYEETLKYTPNNSDLCRGFHRGRELTLETLLKTSEEFYGNQFVQSVFRTVINKRLEELK